MRTLWAFLILLGAVCGSELRIPLFVQKPGREQRSPLATVVYDNEANFLNITDVIDFLPEDAYCVGAQIAENYYSCFSYVKVCVREVVSFFLGRWCPSINILCLCPLLTLWDPTLFS